MIQAPSIQVLMAVFNGQRYIAAQINSIMEQSHRELEITVRDNASTDDTPAIMSDLESRHGGRVRSLPGGGRNVGALGNFARLLDQARPGYVMFSDADDVWLPEKISRTLAKMRELEARFGPETPILVHTDARVVDQSLHTIADSFCRYQYLDPVRGAMLNRLLVQNVVTGCTMMLNAPLVELARPVPTGQPTCQNPGPAGQNGTVQEANTIAGDSFATPRAVMHDWWIGLVAAATGKIGYLPEATLLYRQHGGNDTGAKAWGPRLITKNALTLVQDDSLRMRLRRTHLQAAALLKHLEGRLAAPERELVATYASLPNQSYLGRRRAMLQHGFFKTGLMRNLGVLAAL